MHESDNAKPIVYDVLASDYDQSRFQGAAGAFNARTDARIINELVKRSGAGIVHDIPVGTARVAEYLKKIGIPVVGCDISTKMLEIAKQKAQRLGLQLTLLKVDAEHLPFPDGSIECIVSLRFFHLLEQPARIRFIEEFRRVLKPGGHLICSFTNGFYGIGVNLLRQVLGRFPIALFWPWQKARLFQGFQEVVVRGNFLPFQRFVAKAGMPVEEFVYSCVSRSPVRALCFETFFLLKKRGSPPDDY